MNEHDRRTKLVVTVAAAATLVVTAAQVACLAILEGDTSRSVKLSSNFGLQIA